MYYFYPALITLTIVSKLHIRWRHDLEVRNGERDMLSLISGQPMDWMSPKTPRPKTRWQETAESLFSDLFHMTAFDSSDSRTVTALRMLAGTCDDVQMRRIILFYLATLQPKYPHTEAELEMLLESERRYFVETLNPAAAHAAVTAAAATAVEATSAASEAVKAVDAAVTAAADIATAANASAAGAAAAAVFKT